MRQAALCGSRKILKICGYVRGPQNSQGMTIRFPITYAHIFVYVCVRVCV